MPTQAILTDIEGTTSSLDFVQRTLFPYSAKQMRAFLEREARNEPVRVWVEQIAAETGKDSADLDAINAVLQRWIKEDRKVTTLKAIQGRIWEQGYHSGAFKAHIYPDALRNLLAWFGQGIRLYVYSSGSVEAQNLYFGHTTEGDLRPLFRQCFDTGIGGKKDSSSYERIVREIGLPAADILFLSDVVEELDAARRAGLRTIHVIRDLSKPLTSTHPSVRNFDDIQL
jgi:enolase-phosphatase E1